MGEERPKSILVVEDETIMRESLRDWLTEGGYLVDTAKDSEEALKAIAKQDFGLVRLMEPTVHRQEPTAISMVGNLVRHRSKCI